MVNAFVITPNHIHLIWQIQDGYKPDKIQLLRFQKYTAQQMKVKLIDTNNKMLNDFFVEAKDREYLPMNGGLETKSFKHWYLDRRSIYSKTKLHS